MDRLAWSVLKQRNELQLNNGKINICNLSKIYAEYSGLSQTEKEENFKIKNVIEINSLHLTVIKENSPKKETNF